MQQIALTSCSLYLCVSAVITTKILKHFSIRKVLQIVARLRLIFWQNKFSILGAAGSLQEYPDNTSGLVLG